MKQQKSLVRTSPKETLKKNVTRTDERAKSQVPKSFPKINQRFREWIEKEGVAYVQIANMLSTPAITITVSNVKAIASDTVTPSLFVIKRWRKVSGWSYDYIIDGRD